MNQRRRVVVTGMGVVAPNAHGLNEFEAALREGRSGIRFIPRLAELNFACQVGGVPQGVIEKAPDYFSEEELLSMSETMIYGGIAAIDAWRDAGLEVPDPADDHVHNDTGAIVGLGMAGMDVMVDRVVPLINAGRVRRLGSTIVEQVMASSVSAKLAGTFALGNEVTTNSSACNTGTEALVLAYQRIKDGYADRMVAGSVEGSCAHLWGGFDSMKVLSTRFNDDAPRASRPLSATAGGFVPGSGAGVLILEELETALARGVTRIYGEIVGGAVNSGGHRQGGSMTAPNCRAVQDCIRQAIWRADLPNGREIDAINGHLTGTFADPYEIENWCAGLDVPLNELPPINATKSLIGHGLGAAGSLESVAALLQLSRGFLHGSLNCEDLHEKIKPGEKSIVRTTRDAQLRTLAKASFGFGDVNGCLIFRRIENGSV
jgi:3-oxoacyl-(acyl-carrier-protein) synthase